MKTFPQDGQKVTVHYALFLVRHVLLFKSFLWHFLGHLWVHWVLQNCWSSFHLHHGGWRGHHRVWRRYSSSLFPLSVTRVCRSGSDVPGPESVPHPVSWHGLRGPGHQWRGHPGGRHSHIRPGDYFNWMNMFESLDFEFIIWIDI